MLLAHSRPLHFRGHLLRGKLALPVQSERVSGLHETWPEAASGEEPESRSWREVGRSHPSFLPARQLGGRSKCQVRPGDREPHCLHPTFQSHSLEVLADLAGRRSLGGRVLIADFFFFHSFSIVGIFAWGCWVTPSLVYVFLFAAGSTDVSKSQLASSRKVQTVPSFLETLSPQDQGALWRARSIVKEAGADFPEQYQHCRGNKRMDAANRWEGV